MIPTEYKNLEKFARKTRVLMRLRQFTRAYKLLDVALGLIREARKDGRL